MEIIVVGCGRVGARLAHRLHAGGHSVTVLDADPRAFANLPSDFRGRTIEGEVLAADVLRRAQIDSADGLVSVTSSDAVNAVVAHVARTVYRVPNVFARAYDPRTAPLIEAVGVQSISSAEWGARRFEELLSGAPAHPVFSAGSGEIEVVEIVVPRDWSGRPLAALLDGLNARPVAITRGGAARLIEPDAVLEAGDVVHLATPANEAGELQSRLRGEG